jgi:CheY-like chemotaxis protein
MRSTKSSTAGSSSLILLVDDNKLGLAARRAVLEELGHTVVTAVNGVEAFALAQEQGFDLVITDWKMPKMNGIELIRNLREAEYIKPIVLLSGFAAHAGMSEEATGADAVVQKSANEVQVLVSTVKRLLNRKAPKKGPGTASSPAAKAGRHKAV